MKKSLTIEDLKNRVGKPVFAIATTEEFKHRTAWHILSKISAFKLDNESNGYVEFTDCKCIKFENIQFFRFFDTEVSATELKEILESEEKEKKKTGYEKIGDGAKYYFTDAFLSVAHTNYNSLTAHDSLRCKNGNYFNDEKLCENIARAEQLRYQLRRYAALNVGIPSQEGWRDVGELKWYISYSHHDKIMFVQETSCWKMLGQTYFKSKEVCEKAIEIFKDELLWCFTEFEEMLY